MPQHCGANAVFRAPANKTSKRQQRQRPNANPRPLSSCLYRTRFAYLAMKAGKLSLSGIRKNARTHIYEMLDVIEKLTDKGHE
jgi:hypothetical protein